jgi:heptosyltransferase-3
MREADAHGGGGTTVKEIRRILVYRCGAIGDTVVSIPAIQAIRHHFKGAALILMTATGGGGIIWADEVLREFGWFDAYVRYELFKTWSPRLLWKLITQVRRQRADLVVYLSSDKNSATRIWRDRFFFRVAGVRRFILCYSSKVTFWGHLKRSARVYPHEVTRLLSAVRRCGIEDPPRLFDFPIGERDVRRVSELLEEGRLDAARPLVAMCPGSKQQAKRWPIERYVELGWRLIEEGGVNISIVGGPDEAVAGRNIDAIWPSGRWVNLAARLTILESSELLRRCLFYVGNDTGAMHLATAVGTRCVAIFSAKEPIKSWFPYGDNHIVLRKNVPCQYCYLYTCVKEERRCLTAIGVEEVWLACQRMLVYR